MKNVTDFVKKEIVLCVAVVLAAVSCFFVSPDREYAKYIDYRTLAVLFCLMIVVAGFDKIGLFKKLASELLERTTKINQVVIVLVMLCFVLGMFITNDVALITFVPFTFTVLKLMGKDKIKHWIVPIVCLQTMAANLGSMLTPLGNPQNLYLFEVSQFSLLKFILTVLPYSALSLAMIFLFIFIIFLIRDDEHNTFTYKPQNKIEKDNKKKAKTLKLTVTYSILFVLCILTVVRLIDYRIVFVTVIICAIVLDREVLKKADYSLLLTFTALFVFIGNMGRIESFSSFIKDMVNGHEVITSILVSQVTSNVPAALLLSGFTDEYEKLIVGINIGGLGTLIASMASLISFKLLANEMPEKKKEYIAWFTVMGVVMLIVLYVQTIIMM